MKILRIGLATFISLAMLYIARTNSRGQPEHLSQADGAFRFEMTSVPKVTEHQADRITLTVSGPVAGRRVVFRTSQPDQIPADCTAEFAAIDMQLVDGTPDQYYVDVTAGNKGGRFHYYFEIVDAAGTSLATFKADSGEPFFLRYIGEIPMPVLAGHLFFIFAPVFCVAMAAVHALRVIGGGTDVRAAVRLLFWAAISCFIGGYPLGISMNHFAFGTFWEGVPFGTDATDNKTQLMFVYLLFAVLSSLGSLSGGRFGRDLFSSRTLAWIGLGSFAVMLFIYLIPHSIQFTPLFTYAFCYIWIGIVAALYVFGLLASRAKARS
jgi:hypothetical protein